MLLPWSSFSFRSTHMHMHRITYLAYHTCFASCCLCISRCWLWFRLLVFLSWVEPEDEFVNEEPVEYAYEDQAFDNSSSLRDLRQDDHTLEITTIFDMLVCSLFCFAIATMPTTCLQASPNCHVKPLTHHVLANRWLAMLPLCSALLIALLVAGEDWSRSLLEHLYTCWDITIYLFN